MGGTLVTVAVDENGQVGNFLLEHGGFLLLLLGPLGGDGGGVDLAGEGGWVGGWVGGGRAGGWNELLESRGGCVGGRETYLGVEGRERLLLPPRSKAHLGHCLCMNE